jgi:RNA polymerase sigma-54 factor
VAPVTLSPRLEVRQQQTLALTPQLRQAIKLLQMTHVELSAFVAAEVERNPLIELAPPPDSPGGSVVPSARAAGGDGTLLESVAAQLSLHAHLHGQIGAMRARADAIEAALLIADELEDDGYLRVPLADVGKRHRLQPRALIDGLALVQACEPAGIGARDLRECLALQLRERDRLDPAMGALLDNLGLAARGERLRLREICGVDDEDLDDMLAEIRALDPKPGLRFGEARIEMALPDVYVRRRPEGGWAVELNGETLPRVLVNNVYRVTLGDDAKARAFVSECSASANWLVRSLEQRARTILRVATEIAGRQERFFEQGVSGLGPLTQRAVAEKLGLHESTVSRVAAGKYVACAQGLYPFRFFFSSAVPAVSGGEAFSSAAVQERIRGLIGQEPAGRPWSDDRLVALLEREGIGIARRTVAKYREGMGIPSSVERRRRIAAHVRN